MPPLPRSTPIARRPIWRILGHAGFILLLALTTAWAATALVVQLAGSMQILTLTTLGLACVAILILRFRQRRAAWAVFAAAAMATGFWYQTIHPQQNRDWAADVAHSVSSSIDGQIATLRNVRNFNWISETEATPIWETRSYNLEETNTVDMITSTWGNPNIAHLLVSFGFKDGQHVAFSVEIRREQGERFSSIGGFFRQFELALIAADENDVVRLRTNLRGEDVHLFPVKPNADQRRALFLSYLDLGNRLTETPQFYNTVTANCASVVYRLVQVIKPDLPLDPRLLFSGQLPEYIDELGGLPGAIPMEQRRAAAAISAKAKAIAPGQNFSTVIRQ